MHGYKGGNVGEVGLLRNSCLYIILSLFDIFIVVFLESSIYKNFHIYPPDNFHLPYFCFNQVSNFFFFFLFGSYLGNKVFCAPTLSELFASLGTCTKAEERKKVAMFGEKPFMANTFFSRGGSVACWVSWGAFQIPLTR